MNAATAHGFGGSPARPSMRLLAWKPLVKNSLRGFADIELPNGLRIREVPVLSSNGKCWAALPSKPVLDPEGKPVENGGKKQYSRLLEWRNRELAKRFSAKVVDLVRQAHPGALEGGSRAMIAAAAEISRLLAQNIRSLASELFPSGHREGQEWRAGSLLGEPGNSLGIHLTGPKAGVWSDFASGESGDALDLVRAVHRCDIAGALKWSRRWLGIEHGPADPARHPPELSKPVRPYEDDNPDRWWRPWRTAKPIAATLAETYLRCRGLHFDDPEGRVLRFQTRHARKSPTNEFEHHPAVLALLSDVSTGEPCGIVNIYLQPDGGDRIRDKKSKTSWGRVCAAAVMLDPFDAPVSGLVIAEGVETAISLQMAELHPVWATAGAGNLSVFPILGGIEAIIIAADKGEPGQKAATACGSRWRQAGREALIITPPTAEDWAARRRRPAL